MNIKGAPFGLLRGFAAPFQRMKFNGLQGAKIGKLNATGEDRVQLQRKLLWRWSTWGLCPHTPCKGSKLRARARFMLPLEGLAVVELKPRRLFWRESSGKARRQTVHRCTARRLRPDLVRRHRPNNRTMKLNGDHAAN